jgi:DNA-binding transcriptional LysR family regulator
VGSLEIVRTFHRVAMDFTLRQVQCFTAVADTGQVSAAGAALGMSQSAITTSIQGLEKRTGIKLVRRHRRGVILTREGYQFLGYARGILAAVADAKWLVRSSNANLRGKIKLGVPSTVAGYFLPAPLMRFQRLYPNVAVDVTELDMTKIERALLGESIDIALLLMSTELDARRIETITMFSSQRRLWLSPRHRLASVSKIRLRDVANEPYLLLTIDGNAETTSRYWAKYNLKPHVKLRTISIEAIRNLVARGAGVTILSNLVYRPWSLEGEPIEARALTDAIPDLKIGMAYKKNAQMTDSFMEFRKFFRQEIGMHKNPET